MRRTRVQARVARKPRVRSRVRDHRRRAVRSHTKAGPRKVVLSHTKAITDRGQTAAFAALRGGGGSLISLGTGSVRGLVLVAALVAFRRVPR
jgi:hypothetical protein